MENEKQNNFNIDKRKGLGRKLMGSIKKAFKKKNTRESKVMFQTINDINNINYDDEWGNLELEDIMLSTDQEGFNDRNKRAELHKEYNDNLLISP